MKPIVFNYQDYEKVVRQNEMLKEELTRLRKMIPGQTVDGDLISRQDAIEAIARRDETDGTVKVFTGREVNEILSALPSADRQEVESATIHNEGITFSYRKTGEWIEEDEYGDLWVCDQCGFASEHRDNYCPNCGAKMRGDDE